MSTIVPDTQLLEGPLRGLSCMDPVSLNFATQLCVIGSWSGCSLLNATAIFLCLLFPMSSIILIHSSLLRYILGLQRLTFAYLLTPLSVPYFMTDQSRPYWSYISTFMPYGPENSIPLHNNTDNPCGLTRCPFSRMMSFRPCQVSTPAEAISKSPAMHQTSTDFLVKLSGDEPVQWLGRVATLNKQVANGAAGALLWIAQGWCRQRQCCTALI